MKIQVDIPIKLHDDLKSLKYTFKLNNLREAILLCCENHVNSLKATGQLVTTYNNLSQDMIDIKEEVNK